MCCSVSLAASGSLPVVQASPEPAPSRAEPVPSRSELARLSQAELIRLNNPFDKQYFQLIDALVLKYPHSPDLHLQRGLALADCSRWSESLKDLNEALVLDKSLSGSAALHFQSGNCYAGLKQYEKAAREYELSLAKYGTAGADKAEMQNCLLRLAKTYFQLGKREACAKAYYKAAGLTDP
ncbi:MAG TPA: hypothetical protein PKW73_06220, partial [Candidatus Obscuribacter sp.]|nr:hypothetical protein [Candidatus Obscuribacter sp.]